MASIPASAGVSPIISGPPNVWPPPPKPMPVQDAPISAQGHYRHDLCLALPEPALRRCLMATDREYYGVRSLGPSTPPGGGLY